MGKRYVITCDGVGCDLSLETGIGQTDYGTLIEVTVRANDVPLWNGWLCGPCGNKMGAALKAAASETSKG